MIRSCTSLRHIKFVRVYASIYCNFAGKQAILDLSQSVDVHLYNVYPEFNYLSYRDSMVRVICPLKSAFSREIVRYTVCFVLVL